MEIIAGVLFVAGLLGFLYWIFLVKGLSLYTYLAVMLGVPVYTEKLEEVTSNNYQGFMFDISNQ